MANLIKTGWNLSEDNTINYLMDGLKQISKPLHVEFDRSTNTVKAKYNGMEFDSFSKYTADYDDTIVLDAKKHGHISNYDLEFLGTFLHVHDIGLKLNQDIMYISLDGSEITPDYATWLIKDDHIEVECLIDPINVKTKFPYVGVRQQKILEYLGAHPDVQIIDDGIMDAGDLARQRMAIGQFNSSIPIKPTQFGKILIQLDVGFPDTVKELINYIKRFKMDLYTKVR